MTETAEPGGLALFLQQNLWDRTPGDKYVYDVEEVHYGLLSLLLERMPQFAATLLGSPSRVVRVVQVDDFDLEVRLMPRGIHLIEVKTWNALTADQVDRQAALLEQRSACGIYLLTPFQACRWTSEEILQRSRGRGRLVPFQDVAAALRRTEPSLSDSLREVARSYADAIDLLNRRTAAAV